jgi:hypothetical protein
VPGWTTFVKQGFSFVSHPLDPPPLNAGVDVRW